MVRSVLAAAAIACLFSMQAHAGSTRVAGWDIATFPDTGERTACMMGANYQDGTRLNIVMFRTYSWGLALYNKSWGLTKGRKIHVDAYVDNRLIASGTAEVIASDLVLFPLQGAGTYKSLQAGRRLDLVTPLGRPNFSLTGTSKAMSAVLECVGTLNASDHVAELHSSPTPDYRAVPSAEATVLLTNMLNGAAIQGYKLRPPTPENDVVYFDLADGSTGFFFAFSGAGTPSADDAASSAIQTESKNCKGNYLSGKQSVPSTDGSVIRKLITTCRSGSAGFVTETTIIRRNSGFLITFGRTGSESSFGDMNAATSDPPPRDRALVDAALRIEEPH